jgi:hypothetical protein
MISIMIVRDPISIREYINKIKFIYFSNMSTIGYPWWTFCFLILRFKTMVFSKVISMEKYWSYVEFVHTCIKQLFLGMVKDEKHYLQSMNCCYFIIWSIYGPKKYKGNELWVMFSSVKFWSLIVCTHPNATTSPSKDSTNFKTILCTSLFFDLNESFKSLSKVIYWWC